MFSSIFSTSAEKDGSAAASSSSSSSTATTGQIHPPKERLSTPEAAFGPLTAQDTAWLCAGGFTTETQTFYTLTAGEQPKLVMVQIIHSAVGMWYPQIQFNLLCFDPATGHKEWRSTSVSGFTTAPTIGSTKYDKRSCKSNEFTFLVDPAKSDTYTIEGKYDANTQVSLKVKRMEGAPGFKLGSGPKGGMTYFGAEKTAAASGEGGPDYASASDGYVVHRFWPRCTASGVLRIGNDIVTLDDKAGARGIFIHAIQGMRPNLVACRWNFGYFSGTDASEGVSLMSMEFTTTYTHGNQTVNIGSVVADDRLVAVIADGTTRHLDTDPVDSDTGYPAPGKVQFSWKNGASLQPDMSKTPVSAEITLELGATGKTKSGGRAFNGLIEKVDVLAQIPYLVKKVISYVAGTKPYIYQFLNPTTATLTLPGQTGSEDRKLTVKGYMFNEATFISPN